MGVLKFMADPTGFEPAISSSTERHVNHYTTGPELTGFSLANYGCSVNYEIFDLIRPIKVVFVLIDLSFC